MKKFRLLTLLALLMTAATGAWAQEQSETIVTTATIVEGTHFTISNNHSYADTDGMIAVAGITVTAKNGETITKVVISCTYHPIDVNDGNTSVSSGTKEITNGGATITVTGVNASTFTFTCSESGTQYGQFVVYYTEAPASTTVNLTRGTGDKANEWTFDDGMPAGNVTVNVEYWPGMLTLPAASEGGTVTLEGVTSNTIIDENFDDYTAGGKMAQTANAAGNSNWTTWSNTPGSGEDGTLATLNDNTCLQVIKDNDQVLLLGDKTSGMWEYSFDVYVPEGKFGYFNLLHDFDGNNSTWAIQCYLNAKWEYDGENTSITYSPGHGTVHAGSASTADLPCVVNEWMHVSFVIDIDNDLAKLFFNGDFICEWQWSLESYGEDVISGKLAACDFFGEGDEYYVDNIKFTQITLPAGFEIDGYGNIYVESGTQVNLVTTPAENYHLASLSDGTNTYNVDNDGKVTITMPDADLTLTAEFAENTYNVTFAEGVNPEAPADPVWTATPSTGVKKDDKVTVTYTGDRKVIGVRAEKKAEPTN